MLFPLAFATLIAATPVSDFEHLTPLVGHWRGTGEGGRVIDIRYSLIANGSALVEEWTSPRGNRTMTIYYRDGGKVLATHFCAQGNQPRLMLARAPDNRLRFTFRDATNLARGKSHLHDFWIELQPDGTMRRAEIYRAGSKSEAEEMTLTRVSPSP